MVLQSQHTSIWRGLISHLSQVCWNVTVGCKILHSSSNWTAHPSQFITLVWGPESSRERLNHRGQNCILLIWMHTNEMSCVFRFIQFYKCVWLSFVAPTWYCEVPVTAMGIYWVFLSNQSVISKDHTTQSEGRWGLALPSCGGGGCMLCPNALLLHIMCTTHSSRNVNLTLIPCCWNEWLIEEMMKKQCKKVCMCATSNEGAEIKDAG